MKKHFSNEERYVVYTVHKERCYICQIPLNLFNMEVDHIIPESLEDDPQRLALVLTELGRPTDFDLQSFGNWLPACRPCNLKKSKTIFEPSLLIQLNLQTAAERAPRAEEFLAQQLSDQKVSKAITVLGIALTSGSITNEARDALSELEAMHRPQRDPEAAKEPMHLVPLYEVLGEKNGIRMIKGPYGVGGGPLDPSPSSRCSCGMSAWNGARCVICGEMMED